MHYNSYIGSLTKYTFKRTFNGPFLGWFLSTWKHQWENLLLYLYIKIVILHRFECIHPNQSAIGLLGFRHHVCHALECNGLSVSIWYQPSDGHGHVDDAELLVVYGTFHYSTRLYAQFGLSNQHQTQSNHRTRSSVIVCWFKVWQAFRGSHLAPQWYGHRYRSGLSPTEYSLPDCTCVQMVSLFSTVIFDLASICMDVHLVHTFDRGFGVPIESMWCCWITPQVLSTIQLFYFGTYLPHRGTFEPDSFPARSNSYPSWLSLVTCFHFGYHFEHHKYPYIPWWYLPTIRTQTRELWSPFWWFVWYRYPSWVSTYWLGFVLLDPPKPVKHVCLCWFPSARGEQYS